MARRSYARGARRTSRPSRRSYRATSPRKSYRSRASTRRTTARRGSSARTIRIEIVQPSQSPVSRPDLIGMKVAPGKRKATM